MAPSVPSTDASLWTVAPAFGAAGGLDEVILSAEGRARAFSVGAQVRRGGPAEALEALVIAGGSGSYSESAGGARLRPTAIGKFDQVAWGHLRALGYVESHADDNGAGVRLTDAGRAAVSRGFEERLRLLERCRAVERGRMPGSRIRSGSATTTQARSRRANRRCAFGPSSSMSARLTPRLPEAQRSFRWRGSKSASSTCGWLTSEGSDDS